MLFSLLYHGISFMLQVEVIHNVFVKETNFAHVTADFISFNDDGYFTGMYPRHYIK